MKEGRVNTENSTTGPRSRLSIWVQAVRAFSFTASMVPVIVGAVLALYYERTVKWELLPVILVCSILYHAATNLMSDYFDCLMKNRFKSGFYGSDCQLGIIIRKN